MPYRSTPFSHQPKSLLPAGFSLAVPGTTMVSEAHTVRQQLNYMMHVSRWADSHGQAYDTRIIEIGWS